MKSIFTTEGRISRATFWKFFVVIYAILFLFGGFYAFLPRALQMVVGLLMLPVCLLGIIVQIKRWHDRDKSGWWVLINFIPYLGGIWSLVECGFFKGTTGENRFGPDPLA